MKVLDGPLQEVSRQAREYPAYLLRDRGTGLCLFAARFYGVNDAIHMARAEMELDLVDTSERVLEMGEMYGARAHLGDAWEYAQEWSDEGRQWDAVSCDTFTGDPQTKSLGSLELWCSLAKEVVTVTHTNGADYTIPDGWEQHALFERNPRGGVNWLVLTRA